MVESGQKQTEKRDITSLRAVIVGAGLGGLNMAVKLRAAGISNIEILEKGSGVGGTWHWNTYPGAACDVPSPAYSFTYFWNPGWSQSMAPGFEIRGYLEALAAKFDLVKHLRFDTEVVECRYVDRDDASWVVRTSDGNERVVDIVVMATGFLHVPKLPDIRGLEDFAGPSFHTAEWDHSVDLSGKRVANIGNGSSTSQVLPAIIEKVGEVYVFQRTPQWVLPVPNERFTTRQKIARRIFRSLNKKVHDEVLETLNTGFGLAVVGDKEQAEPVAEACRANLETIRDPELRAKLTPDYEVGCKRLVMSEKFYDAVQDPSCELVTDRIERIEPTGIRTADGKLREVDVLILATGFDAHAYFRGIGIVGENGRRLEDAWRDGPRSFNSTALAGFPNLFMVGGPYTTVGNLSNPSCAEYQADYIVELIELATNRGARAVVPTQEAEDAFVGFMRERAPKTVWASGCNTFYLDKDGRIDIWTGTPQEYMDLMDAGPQVNDYRLIS
jgi:cation diffusion facilitator CzcD-associated flavoprotein CzcO